MPGFAASKAINTLGDARLLPADRAHPTKCHRAFAAGTLPIQHRLALIPYILRVIAGAAATGVVLSFWLLAFPMFLFLSLALVKRYAELLLMQQERQEETAGRDYWLVDLETLSQFGITSGYLAVLVLVLYINGDTVGAQYRHPEVIWLLCPSFL